MEQNSDPYTLLKKFLLNLAHNYNYKFDNSAKTCLKDTITYFFNIPEHDLKIDHTIHYHKGRTCGHRFVRGETCWRCLTCGYDDTCALCQFCYNEEDHLGHDVHSSTIQRDFAGCCDCGDEEAYKGLQCPLYTQPHEIPIQTEINQEVLDHVSRILGILLDFVIDFTNHSLSCLSPSDRAEKIKLRHQMCALSQSVYQGIDNDTNKYGLVLYSDQVHQFRDAVQRIRIVTGKVKEYAEMIATRCNTHGRAVVMISENLNDLLRKQTLLTTTGLTACIKNVREIFREEMCDEIISWINDFTQSNIVKSNVELLAVIPKTFLSAYNPGCMNQWMDIFYDKVLINPMQLRDRPISPTDFPAINFNENNNVIPKFDSTPVWDLPESLKNDCQYHELSKEKFKTYKGSRLQFLLIFDIRFCKTTRINLHSIYIPSLAKNCIYSRMLVAQFLDIYDTILTSFLMVDREPELSVMPLLSTQLFSSPSNSSLILKHGDAIKMITTIHSYILTGKTLNILHPSEKENLPHYNITFSTLKNRKWAHVLLDLSYIITRNPDINNIFRFFVCFPKYVNFLADFQGKPTFQREAEKHVEYENQEYTVYFNAMSVISHFSENVGKILNKIPKQRLLSQGNPLDIWYNSSSNTMIKPFTESVYVMIIRSIINSSFVKVKTYPPLPVPKPINDEKQDVIQFKPCKEFPDFNVVKFNVAKDPASFLHPLHVMLSWMIEMDQSMDSEKAILNLMDIIQGEYEFYLKDQNNVYKHPKYEGVMAVFDIPLRKIVLVSQIKSGLWVRNGVSVKNQMTLYRYGSGREFGFMRDLFLCQIYVGYFRYAQLVSHTIFDRWMLLPWLNDDMKQSAYHPQHINGLLEEFMLFLINLVTEDLHLHKLSADDVTFLMIQHEIIHAICFEKKTYNEIVLLIPDHICSLKKFPIAFKYCVEPVKEYTDISEEKYYRLKPQFYDTIDPFYIHLNSNRRENCILQMKKHISKRDKVLESEVVIMPKKIDWSKSPFARVTDILLDEKVLLCIFKSLQHCKNKFLNAEDISSKQSVKENNESLLGLVLHLTHITIDHKNIMDVKPVELSRILVEISKIYESNKVDEHSAKMKFVMKKIYNILSKMEFDIEQNLVDFNPNILDENYNFTDSDIKSISDLSIDRKKKLAKKKRNKLLAKLKKQQQKFAEVNMMDDLTDTATIDSGSDISRSVDFGSESVSRAESSYDRPLTDGDFNMSYFGNPNERSIVENDEERLLSLFEKNLTNASDSFVQGNKLNGCIPNGGFIPNSASNENILDDDEEKCPSWKFPEHTCLLCHMPAANENEVFGIFSYITETNVFRYVPPYDDYHFYNAFGGNVNLDEVKQTNESLEQYTSEVEKEHVIGPGLPDNYIDPKSIGFTENAGVFTSCSHGMHLQCYKQHFEASLNKQYTQITRTTPENIKRREFSCPLCKSINNVFIPVLYKKNSKKFYDNFQKKIDIELLDNVKLSDRIMKDTMIYHIRTNIIEELKSNFEPKDWFINERIGSDGLKKYTLLAESRIPLILQECLIDVAHVAPPFDSFGSSIYRTIESLEISLRGEGYEDVPNGKKKKLLINQLNNRSITSLRVWLQICEIMKTSLGIKRDDNIMNESNEVYPQSLIGMYYNLLEDNELIFSGQDYFSSLIYCDEVKSLGYSFQRLVGVFFIKHIKQSLMKIMITLMKRNGHIGDEERIEILKTQVYYGDDTIMRMIINKFMNIEYEVIKSELIDVIYSMLIKMITPFLRKVLILSFAKFSRFEDDKIKMNEDDRECDRICDVLNLPRVDEILEQLDTKIFEDVSSDKREELFNSRMKYPSKVKLIHLPKELNRFYTEYYNKLREEDRYDEPGVCLFCAEIVDIQNNRYGDEYGSCTMHLKYECINGGKGIFFLPRNNCCLLLDNGKGSFIDSPYRDEFGEVDKDCKKGHNVWLSDRKYDEMEKKIWLTHNVPNVIAQKLENWNDMGGWSTL